MKMSWIGKRAVHVFLSLHHWATRGRGLLSFAIRLKPNTPLLEVIAAKAKDRRKFTRIFSLITIGSGEEIGTTP